MIEIRRTPRLGARILVVEDDADSAESSRVLLKLFSHDVQIVPDGHQAIASALSWRPDFILLDIGLPGLDGYQVAARLRQEASCQQTVIIAVTGYAQAADRERSCAVGIDHHLVKPVDLEELLALLSSSDAESDREAGVPDRVTAGPPPGVIRREEGRILAVRRHVEVTNALGLHLRAADQLARLARQFHAEVRVACDGRRACGRSILDLLTLAAPCGTRLELEADGPEAAAALDALAGLIARGFDEPA